MSPKFRIIGVGNDYRRDDAAGLAAARNLRELRLPGVTVLEKTGDAAELLELWQDPTPAILIDAMRSGVRPGTLRRFDAAQEPIPAALFCSTSSHSFGVVESLELARAFEQLPARLIVYGIEGKSFGPGLGLSPEVRQALPGLVAQIRRDLDQFLSGASP